VSALPPLRLHPKLPLVDCERESSIAPNLRTYVPSVKI
jgi:hypothetical protein